MNVALIGSVSSSWHALRGLITGGVEVTGVLGLDPSASTGVSDYRNLREAAAAANIPYRSFRKVSEEASLDFVRAHPADLLFVIGLSQLIPDSMFSLARAGLVGFHPTALPRGRGRAPVAWTILLNQPAAANLFFLTSEADAGDLIDRRPVELLPDDYAQDLIDRTNVVLESMIIGIAPSIKAGRLLRWPQDHAQATWYAKRTPEDGRIDWAESADSIYRLVRAASRPYPGAFTTLAEHHLHIWRAAPHHREDHFGTIGQIVRIDAQRGLLVQCGRGLLWLTELADSTGARAFESFRVGTRLGLDACRAIEDLRERVRRLEEHQNSR